MASERLMQRCREAYAKLICLYPTAYRERFGEGMTQTFNDLCRERLREKTGLLVFAVWTFVETAAAIFRENAKHMMRSGMKQDSRHSLKMIKYAAMAVGALMVAGIATLMFLARGKGEDIAGIIAPALLVTILSGVVAAIAAFLQKRAQNP
jgi:hypothetical protein